MPTEKKGSVHPSTRKGLEAIGHHVITLVRSLPPIVTYQTEYELGRLFDGLIVASVKGQVPGDQTDAQVETQARTARKAFARKLARAALTA